ncbi:hypothetical protein Agub_g14298 [Astrephomene gubernaculifera]|uniref:Mechanosensitive ion channel MscS domain-containing protein n=1 Tax=Astrephomene gubernaculifera TaxID=47775 RepID=A0AAD3E192_9CHLO|nr:hypothetical protein Agub_g14298 [Astrephomene gubernaculifera]
MAVRHCSTRCAWPQRQRLPATLSLVRLQQSHQQQLRHTRFTAITSATAAAANSKVAVATAAAAAAAAVAGPPLVYPPHTQDPQVIYRALSAPLIAALGGEGSWQLYLATRFTREVLAGVAAALFLYGMLLRVVDSKKQRQQQLHASSSDTGSSSSNSSSIGGVTSASSSSNEMILHLAAVALTSPQARLLLGGVLAVNVARNTMYILDGFISKFNPRLPNDWLDDLVRLLAESLDPLDCLLTRMSLVGTALFGCAVLLRWKDSLVSYFVRQHVEGLERGQEVVQNFINPASNLLSWVVVVAVAGWLATGLGVNLQQPLLAVGGASGIIIGLATQQVLGNFVSGLNIYLARPFVAGEYISLISQNLTTQTQVSGRVIRIDPLRTLIAAEDHTTIAVPNQVIAVSIVVNRSRTPALSAGGCSPLLSACPRELRWRMRLPHEALGDLQALEERINVGLADTLPTNRVRCSPAALELLRFTESGAEVAGKVNLAWPKRRPAAGAEQRGTQEALIQAALLELHRVVRGCGGSFLAH